MVRPRSSGPIAQGLALLWLSALAGACGRSGADHTLRPDSLLRAELGLTDADRVHRIVVLGGEAERVNPTAVDVLEGDWIEFVTRDWRVHEVRFEVDSLPDAARSFLEDTDQVASPPLVQLDARFVLHFRGAPEGRYPFVVEGNGAPVRGVVVVGPSR